MSRATVTLLWCWTTIRGRTCTEWYGRYHYFAPAELIPLESEAEDMNDAGGCLVRVAEIEGGVQRR